MGWIVLGRALDLILRQGDEDLLVIDVDPLDRPRRDDDLPPEDPRPRVHDDVGEPCIGRGLIDLSDRSISRLNVTANQRLPRSWEVLAECPDIGTHHAIPPFDRSPCVYPRPDPTIRRDEPWDLLR